MAGNVTEPVLIFKLCEEMSDAVRVYRLAVVIDDQIILFEMLVKFFIGKAEPLHKFHEGNIPKVQEDTSLILRACAKGEPKKYGNAIEIHGKHYEVIP